jgi:predicted membrane-bound spermidine synthase
MLDLKPLFTTINVALWVLWPISAVAATQSFGENISGLNLLSILMTMMISSLSGLTALLHHMKQDLERNGTIKNLGLYISSKMLGSNVAGLAMLFWTEGGFNPNTQAGLIIIAAFGGTWFLERVLAHLIDKVAPKKETL